MTTEDAKRAFFERLKREIETCREQLGPLESGTMHIGRREPGSDWQDITEQEIERLKNEIRSYQEIIDRYS